MCLDPALNHGIVGMPGRMEWTVDSRTRLRRRERPEYVSAGACATMHVGAMHDRITLLSADDEAELRTCPGFDAEAATTSFSNQESRKKFYLYGRKELQSRPAMLWSGIRQGMSQHGISQRRNWNDH